MSESPVALIVIPPSIVANRQYNRAIAAVREVIQKKHQHINNVNGIVVDAIRSASNISFDMIREDSLTLLLDVVMANSVDDAQLKFNCLLLLAACFGNLRLRGDQRPCISQLGQKACTVCTSIIRDNKAAAASNQASTPMHIAAMACIGMTSSMLDKHVLSNILQVVTNESFISSLADSTARLESHAFKLWVHGMLWLMCHCPDLRQLENILHLVLLISKEYLDLESVMSTLTAFMTVFEASIAQRIRVECVLQISSSLQAAANNDNPNHSTVVAVAISGILRAFSIRGKEVWGFQMWDIGHLESVFQTVLRSLYECNDQHLSLLTSVAIMCHPALSSNEMLLDLLLKYLVQDILGLNTAITSDGVLHEDSAAVLIRSKPFAQASDCARFLATCVKDLAHDQLQKCLRILEDHSQRFLNAYIAHDMSCTATDDSTDNLQNVLVQGPPPRVALKSDVTKTLAKVTWLSFSLIIQLVTPSISTVDAIICSESIISNLFFARNTSLKHAKGPLIAQISALSKPQQQVCVSKLIDQGGKGSRHAHPFLLSKTACLVSLCADRAIYDQVDPNVLITQLIPLVLSLLEKNNNGNEECHEFFESLLGFDSGLANKILPTFLDISLMGYPEKTSLASIARVYFALAGRSCSSQNNGCCLYACRVMSRVAQRHSRKMLGFGVVLIAVLDKVPIEIMNPLFQCVEDILLVAPIQVQAKLLQKLYELVYMRIDAVRKPQQLEWFLTLPSKINKKSSL